MLWVRDFFYRFIVKRAGERDGSEILDHAILRQGPVDMLYFFLGIFTHVYGLALTFLFFSARAEAFPALVGLLGALQEPYLGGLGVYVLLKEVRKRYHKEISFHWGEYFVMAWVVLLAVSTVATISSREYRFDEVYKMIVTNGLATLVIYIGGLIHRP